MLFQKTSVGDTLGRVRWEPGQHIVHREIWRGRPWHANMAIVVEDTAEALVSYTPEGSPHAFPASADGRKHPWDGRQRWVGNGVLMLQRPGEAYAVWHFWEGEERAFDGWYLNLQEPFRRTAIGFDTQDLELDIWLPLDGNWRFKDDELLEVRIADGRFTSSQVERIRELGSSIGAMLDRGERWWADSWTAFTPDPGWVTPAFPAGWEDAAIPAPAGLDELVALPVVGRA